MGFVFEHQVRFHETDGAGVVYFANGLVMCHIAYEASLAAAGLNIGDIFQAQTRAYPIIHASMDYRRPLRCGDRVAIHLNPTRLNDSTFEIHYQVMLGEILAAQAITRHVCIETTGRHRCALPTAMERWLMSWIDQPTAAGEE
ncbi:acyl-CoA thioesterase [Nodosilinea sp. LEGE 07088]|uniref:acyl-CoA thioesterase n=1 Tax=Nodosilinea sp. LEGE 07088 TaxID=2777968 RepID=UPI0018812829|nr:thioesterase family protein [Nodosilinea sp. LEGE 07088]MBE9137424.1 acyl-CoA thioesterase [Nodosilinea sp. LEGE 07088]